jgi:glucosylceramidase
MSAPNARQQDPLLASCVNSRSDPLTRRAVLKGAAELVASAAWPRLARAATSQVEWYVTTASSPWQKRQLAVAPGGAADVFVQTDAPLQAIEGFGACFNELGWTSLSMLSEADRDSVLRELFAPGVGAGFILCRMPVGANDFSRDWYSYDEADGDFALERFSIANDLETLVPFIKAAQRH